MPKSYVWVNHGNLDFGAMPYRNAYKTIAGPFEFAVDRFNVTDGLLELNTTNIVKPPSYSLSNLSADWLDRYFDTLDLVADRVYQQAGDDKIIYLLYSGGLDSLCVLVALQRSSRYKEFLEQGRLKLSLTSTSIQENAEFFFSNILPDIPLCALNYDTLMNDPQALLVTGDMGDHIIGSSDSLESSQRLDLPCSAFFEEHKQSPREYIELAQLAKARQPFEIKTSAQLQWWIIQCYCYQIDIARQYFWSTTSDFSTMAGDTKVFRFFYDDLITTFSYEYMSTNPRIESFEDCRTFPKKYIANHMGNDSIFSKPKVYSQRLTLRTVNKTSIYIEDGVYGYEMSNNTIR